MLFRSLRKCVLPTLARNIRMLNSHCACGLLQCISSHCPIENASNWNNIEPQSFLAPYQGSSWEVIDEALSFVDLKSTDSVLDIGAGDGRIMIKAVINGAKYVEGWEIQKEVYNLANSHILVSLSETEQKKVKLVCGDALTADFNHFNVIILYLLPEGLSLIKDKLFSKLLNNTKILTIGWPFTDIKADREKMTSGGIRLFLYNK